MISIINLTFIFKSDKTVTQRREDKTANGREKKTEKINPNHCQLDVTYSELFFFSDTGKEGGNKKITNMY